jgi:hypothetical protein
MKISISTLRQIIREEVSRAAAGPDMTLLSKIARTRPRPDASLTPAERESAKDLKSMGYVEWDLGSKGWIPTPKGLDALGRR